MAGMGSTGFRSVVAPRGAPSPIGRLARRRPLLTLKAKHLDEGGEVGEVGDASVDAPGSGSDGGGFLGSPEIGGHRGESTNANVASGLTAAQDSLAGDRTFGGRLGDFLLGERELSFNAVTGKFEAERDWAATAGRAAVTSMFGPLGPLVSLGMRAGKHGDPLSPDRSGHLDRGAGMVDGGVGMADGGTPPPAVQALIQQAMSQGKAPPGAQAAPGAPQEPPGPFRFIPDPAELQRRYATKEEPPMLDGGALQQGGGRSGLIQGGGDGRSDDVDSLLDEDGYVIPASEVSAAGNGSSAAGAARIARDVIGRPEAAQPLERVDGGNVPAKVSRDEMYIAPDDVERAGGAGALERFVKQTRARHVRDLKKRPGPRR